MSLHPSLHVCATGYSTGRGAAADRRRRARARRQPRASCPCCTCACCSRRPLSTSIGSPSSAWPAGGNVIPISALVRYTTLETSPVVGGRLHSPGTSSDTSATLGAAGDDRREPPAGRPGGGSPLVCLALGATVVALSRRGTLGVRPRSDPWARRPRSGPAGSWSRCFDSPTSFAFHGWRGVGSFAVLAIAVVGSARRRQRLDRPSRRSRAPTTAAASGLIRSREAIKRGGRASWRSTRPTAMRASPSTGVTGRHPRRACSGGSVAGGGRSWPSTGAVYRRTVEPRMHLADFLRHGFEAHRDDIGCEQERSAATAPSWSATMP